MGEQSAVVWKRLYLSPFAARRSAVGVAHGPPKALDAAKPASSMRMRRTFGAPSGGRSGSIGGKDVAGSFASYVVNPIGVTSGIGRTSRCSGFSGMRFSPRTRCAFIVADRGAGAHRPNGMNPGFIRPG